MITTLRYDKKTSLDIVVPPVINIWWKHQYNILKWGCMGIFFSELGILSHQNLTGQEPYAQIMTNSWMIWWFCDQCFCSYVNKFFAVALLSNLCNKKIYPSHSQNICGSYCGHPLSAIHPN